MPQLFGKDNPMYGKSHTKEARKSISEAAKRRTGKKNPFYGKHHSRATIRKISRSRIGTHISEEHKKRISEANMGIHKGKNHHFYGKHLSKEHREKLSKVQIGRVSPMKGKHHTKTAKNKISKATTGKNNPFYGKHHTKEIREKISRTVRRAQRRLWKTVEHQKKMSKAFKTKPNKAEQVLDNLLQELTFGDYEYVGNFTTFIGGKNPDFININGQKKVIELAGDYWHDKKYPLKRIRHFKKYGFDTLVIWESELKKNIEEVTNKILLFNYLNVKGKYLLHYK